jgi:hypothetical protein
LLCALTSAGRVRFQAQRETRDATEKSGKFDAMLRDIFGRTFPENEWFEVEANMAASRAQIVELLGSTLIGS